MSLPWQAARRRRAEVRKFLYRLFLKSKEWQELRQEIKELNREANGGYLTCERCNAACEYDNCVHHLNYHSRGRQDTCFPQGWLPFPDTGALQLLCSPCHRFLHGRGYDPLCPPEHIAEVERMVDDWLRRNN